MSPERRLRKGAYRGADGLPRPIRGYEPRDDGQRREHRRLYAFKQLAIEIDSLPHSLQRLLLEHQGTLPSVQRRRLLEALLVRGVDGGRIGLVLQLLGDAPSGDADLQAMLAERERARRTSDNFSVLDVQRGYLRRDVRHAPRLHFTLTIQLDEQPARTLVLDLVPEDLVSLPRFRMACIKQAAFVPLFKEGGSDTFHRFVDDLLEPLREEDARA